MIVSKFTRVTTRDRSNASSLATRAATSAIEVRGCFWHGHTCGRCRIPVTRRAYWTAKIARNRRRDRRTRAALRRQGWRVLVVWECQTRDAARLRARLVRFLDE